METTMELMPWVIWTSVLIVSISPGLVLLYYFKKTDYGRTGIIFGPPITALLFLATLIASLEGETVEREYDRMEIVAISNKATVNGNFFLLSGQINSEPYYFFYRKLESGGVKLGKVSAEYAVIFEGDRTDAYVTALGTFTRRFTRKAGWIPYLIPPFLYRSEEWSNPHFKQRNIYLPKGSVKKDLSVSLKDL